MGDNHQTVDVSVIIPCYNEADSLKALSNKLTSHLSQIEDLKNWQLVFISNGCSDNTAEILTAISKQYPSTATVFLKKPNYGYALRKGLEEASGRWAMIINVDFWNPDFITWSWHKRNDYDLIVGSKRSDPLLDQRSKFRKLLSWGLNSILQAYFGCVVSDTHGLKLLNMSSLGPILSTCVLNRGQFDTEFTLKSQRKGLWIAEIPVPITESRNPRNLMIIKILQNLYDITRLKTEMKNCLQKNGIFFHRYSSQDIYQLKTNLS